jgi:hypothetical protein
MSVQTSSLHFGQTSPDDILDEFTQAIVRGSVHQNRVNNRTRNMPSHYDWAQHTNELPIQLPAHVCIPPRPHDEGSDIEQEEEEESDNTDSVDKVTSLWRMFNQDISTKSPNQKHASNSLYTKLTNNQRKTATERTYQNPVLSDYFHDCQWRYANKGEWDTLFKEFFPQRDVLKRHPRAQNCFGSRYYKEWEKLKVRVDIESYKTIRKALKRRFDKLYWMPRACSDRIWSTKYDDKMVKISGIARKNPSLQVLVNSGPNNPPQW